MARRGRSRSTTGSSADTSDITLGPDLNGLLEPLPALPVDPVSMIDEFMQPAIPYDRRAFSFGQEWQSPTMEVSHGKASSSISTIPSSVSVVRPEVVAVCVRRKQRREVLFAFRRQGRGGAKRRRRNEWSNVHCK